ncbi:MAG: hypothetical protein J0L61_04405 [Planctomycetes bacterium]|nr:hypothetical protein [Planctomycetota bacterium]
MTTFGALPVGDWQFWLVTLVVGAAAAWLLRGLVPLIRGTKGRSQRATLTVSGKPVARTPKDRT